MTIKIGHYNWGKLDSKKGFYPEDLPKDWKLAYYANEFECVELDIDQYTEQEISELCDDLPEEFEVILRSSSVEKGQQLEQELSAMGVNVLGCRNVSETEIQIQKISVIYQSETKSLIQWKEFVEQWAGRIGSNQAIILLDAKQIGSAPAAEIRIMIEMMGL